MVAEAADIKDMNFKNFGLDFGNPDFIKLAESFGAKGYRIKKASELAPTLKRVLNSKGINIVECPIDYSKTNDALGKKLKAEINKIK